jgi:heptosyltransferase-2/heptosyltransferase-3
MQMARRTVRLAGLRAAGRILAARRSRTFQPGKRRARLLLIRPDHLGDVLLAAPTAHLLADALPGAEVDWLVGPWTAEVVSRSGGPGQVLTCEFPGFTRRPKGSPVEPYRVLWHEAQRLRQCRYDAALILRPDHWWGALLAAVAGVPRRFGFDIAECRPFLTDVLPPPTGHAVVASQDLGRLAARALVDVSAPARALQLDAPYRDPSFAVTAGERQQAARLLHQTFGDDFANGPVIALHPGTGALLKNWTATRWAAVAARLQATVEARIVLTGGPDERELVAEITSLVTEPVLNLAGETTLGELAAVFERAALVLGGDSGPLHLAAAVGTPTLRVYGPTSTAVFGPWGDPERQRALVAGLPCQPCGFLVSPPCGATRDPACLQAISVEQVLAAVRAMLASADVPPAPGEPALAPTGAEL